MQTSPPRAKHVHIETASVGVCPECLCRYNPFAPPCCQPFHSQVSSSLLDGSSLASLCKPTTALLSSTVSQVVLAHNVGEVAAVGCHGWRAHSVHWAPWHSQERAWPATGGLVRGQLLRAAPHPILCARGKPISHQLPNLTAQSSQHNWPCNLLDSQCTCRLTATIPRD